ncbi:MAG: PQQ-like beta-propeller repeat protein [Bacteroidales bacterium]|nr:PQQ-like beta-propeller repeat protein [Bacteroidales bacterium]MDD2812878.1 PQQ-like beta-propeller repeat protein [Bacteroidales bacterium]NLO68275.1 PQQ-binding-like beta-propeller repeat protein [Bacteroidales bacterium]
MRKTTIFLLLLILTTGLQAQRTQFRGTNRDGRYEETGLLTSWPENGPAKILTVEGIGVGFSSAVIDHQQNIYVTGMKDRVDHLTCITPLGTIKWQVPCGDSWGKSFPDTRSTPTIDGNRIYVTSGQGRLTCFNLSDGKAIWSREVDQDFGCTWHKWGVSESPLIWNNLVISTPAGEQTTVIALDKMTGKTVWSTPSVGGIRTYASPVLKTIHGKELILAVTTEFITAVNPSSGEVLWSYRHWVKDREVNDDGGHIFPNSPVVVGDEIFITRGYDYPAMMLKVAPDHRSVSEKWISNVLDNHHHGVIVHEGYIYGSNWLNNGKGRWVCLDWATGEVQWDEDWKNKGPIIFADGLLYLMEERTGNVALVKPDPTEFRMISTFKLEGGTGPFWAHPAIYDGKLYLRHGDVLMVYDIKKK